MGNNENKNQQSALNTIMSAMGILFFMSVILMRVSGFNDFGSLTTSVLYREDVLHNIANASEQLTEDDQTSCKYAKQSETKFKGDFISIRRKGVLESEEMYQVQVFIKNTGNVPWFSNESACPGEPIVNLGTTKEKDRLSQFATFLGENDSGWLSRNRIKMDQKRVSPGQIASFTFWVEAPTEPGRYREFFSPVVEGIAWIEGDATFSTDFRVGDIKPLNSQSEEYLSYIEKSVNISKLDLSGEKKILADLSDQRMKLQIGDTIIRDFPMSSGKRTTPTPTGTFKILSQQEVRIASKSPHYIMPYFNMFTNVGHGIHALPSLGNDRGVFWSEALSHIGTPVSHGCIRLLPEDAKFVFEFAGVGTPIHIQW